VAIATLSAGTDAKNARSLVRGTRVASLTPMQFGTGESARPMVCFERRRFLDLVAQQCKCQPHASEERLGEIADRLNEARQGD
jgi:hypothetical protein